MGELARPPVASVPVGTVLADRYRILKWIGSGGMGAVYEALDLDLEELIALKLLHGDLGSERKYRQRIREEVRLARRVSHPNVCRVHDLGYHGQQLFVTMELLRGQTLRSLFRREGPTSLAQAALARRIDIVVQICSGLAAAHSAGVMHRDVKPDNIIVEEDGRAVLTDFGIASLAAELSRRHLVAGTPGYIAPEVLRGEPFDNRVDVYACGVLAWELIARRRPFKVPDIKTARRLAHSRPKLPPLPPECAPPIVLEALDRVLAQALAPDPDSRMPSVEMFAEALARAARGDEPMPFSLDTRQPAGFYRVGDLVSSPTPWGMAKVTPGSGEPLHTPKDSGISGEYLAYSTPTQSSGRGQVAGARRSQIRVVSVLHFRPEPTFLGGPAQAEAESPQASPSDQGSAPSGISVLTGTSMDNLERVVVDFGGTPILVTDDRLTAVFGAPIALGDDAARAARAALTLVEISGNTGRAGIDTDRVLFRSSPEGTPSASGDALARAQELASDANAGEVRVSPATARHLVGRFLTSEVPRLTQSFEKRALIVHPQAPEGAMLGLGDLPLLVARNRELGQLEELVRQACENRSPRYATVLSPQGYGKSRLRLELTRRLRERRDLEWLVARTTPLGEAAPLALLHAASPEWFASATGKEIQSREAAFTAARRWLVRRAARRPVCLLIEDLHWADDASLAFLMDLRQSLDGVPVAILVFCRPDLEIRLPGWFAPLPSEEASHLVMRLDPLDDRSALELATALAPSASDELLRELVQRAEGNPFFIEELARNLQEQRINHSTSPMVLPPTVEAVIQARLDRLYPTEREVACAAAVVGREFWREAARAALADRSALSDVQLDLALAELERRSIVFALPPSGLDDDRYTFEHTLVRDVAYQQLAPSDRRRAHIAVARWLEQRAYSKEAPPDPMLIFAIARHLDMGGDRSGAREAYRRAGARSLELFAYREAARSLRRAQELSEHPDADLLEKLGDAVLVAEDVKAAWTAYLAALDLVSQDSLLTARLYEKLGGCAQNEGDAASAVAWFEKGLAAVAPEGALTEEARENPTIPASLYSALGWTTGYVLGNRERGLAACERAVALLEGTPHQRDLAHAYSRLGTNYMRMGLWRDQTYCYQRQLEIARELAQLDLQCYAHVNIGVALTNLGEIDQALQHTREALVLAARMGDSGTAALARSNLAGLLIEKGDLTNARIELDEALRVSKKVGMRTFVSEAHTYYARLLYLSGDLEGAIAMAHQAIELATRSQDTVDHGIALRILGLLLVRQGKLEDAKQAISQSLSYLKDADPCEEARTQVAEARLLVAGKQPGDLERAQRLLDAAQETFTRLGASLDLTYLHQPQDIR